MLQDDDGNPIKVSQQRGDGSNRLFAVRSRSVQQAADKRRAWVRDCREGAAVSVPLRREGFSSLKSFWYGQVSGAVEPIFGVIGAAMVVLIRPILPYALAFAAGAMIYVVVEELIPESQLEKNTHAATLGAMGGFAVMMILDVALG